MSMLRLIPSLIISEFVIMVAYVALTPGIKSAIDSIVGIGDGAEISSLGNFLMSCYHMAFLILVAIPLIYGFWYATRREYDQYYQY